MFALLLISCPPEMEMLEIKQLKDEDLRDKVFISFFFPQLSVGNGLTKKSGLIHMGFKKFQSDVSCYRIEEVWP